MLLQAANLVNVAKIVDVGHGCKIIKTVTNILLFSSTF